MGLGRTEHYTILVHYEGARILFLARAPAPSKCNRVPYPIHFLVHTGTQQHNAISYTAKLKKVFLLYVDSYTG
jgi:hypothetical protein